MNTLIAISGLGVFCLIAEIFNFRKAIVPVVILGLLAILGTTLNIWSFGDTNPDNAQSVFVLREENCNENVIYYISISYHLLI